MMNMYRIVNTWPGSMRSEFNATWLSKYKYRV